MGPRMSSPPVWCLGKGWLFSTGGTEAGRGPLGTCQEWFGRPRLQGSSRCNWPSLKLTVGRSPPENRPKRPKKKGSESSNHPFWRRKFLLQGVNHYIHLYALYTSLTHTITHTHTLSRIHTYMDTALVLIVVIIPLAAAAAPAPAVDDGGSL